MSGTSVDAIDVAAADLDPNDDVLELTPLGYVEHRYTERLRESVRAALPPGLSTSEQLCRLDTRLGQIFAEAAGRGVQELAGGQADLVVSLGQTIYHWVEGGQCLGTLQLG
ncbi:MAG TPA: anhydro-N-acetylmuramic acid kinase, partial [Jiangellaceae bacterium]|nr:anhydro-N-acetylmuramic acid kinase [Jiangellaceae bacterium]